MKQAPLDGNDIYISFIEETVMNLKYEGYIAGRIEVTHPTNRIFASEEIRFLTNEIDAFRRFRDRWDMKVIDHNVLNLIREVVQHRYCGRAIH